MFQSNIFNSTCFVLGAVNGQLKRGAALLDYSSGEEDVTSSPTTSYGGVRRRTSNTSRNVRPNGGGGVASRLPPVVPPSKLSNFSENEDDDDDEDQVNRQLSVPAWFDRQAVKVSGCGSCPWLRKRPIRARLCSECWRMLKQKYITNFIRLD